jgi:hypothetical protein
VLVLQECYQLRTGSLCYELLLTRRVVRVQSARSLVRAHALHQVRDIATGYTLPELSRVEREYAVLRIQVGYYFLGDFDQGCRHAKEELVRVTSGEGVAVAVAGVLPLLPVLATAKVLSIHFDFDLDNLFAGVGDYIGSHILIDGNSLLAESKVFKDCKF